MSITRTALDNLLAELMRPYSLKPTHVTFTPRPLPTCPSCGGETRIEYSLLLCDDCARVVGCVHNNT